MIELHYKTEVLLSRTSLVLFLPATVFGALVGAYLWANDHISNEFMAALVSPSIQYLWVTAIFLIFTKFAGCKPINVNWNFKRGLALHRLFGIFSGFTTFIIPLVVFHFTT